MNAGKTRRALGRRAQFHKLKDFKRALVLLKDASMTIKAPEKAAKAQELQ